MFKTLMTISAICLLWSGTAQAENINLSLKRVQGLYQGGPKNPGVITLKAKARRQMDRMGQNLDKYQLVGVSVKARRIGQRGNATLVAGGQEIRQRVPKGLKVGKGDGQVIFDTFIGILDENCEFNCGNMSWNLNQPASTDSAWQLHLRGKVDVHSVVLHLQSKSQRQRIAIPMRERRKGQMRDMILRGQNTLPLKQLAREKGKNFTGLRGKKLRKIILVAKSKNGNGQSAAYIVNRKNGNNILLGEMPVRGAKKGYDFRTDDKNSYRRIEFMAPRRQPKGPWELDLRGRIKIKRIVLVVE